MNLGKVISYMANIKIPRGEIGKVSQKLQAAGGDSEDLAKSFKNQEKTVKNLESSSKILQEQITIFI